MQNDSSNPSLKNPPRFVDLFCGIGSFHQSLSALGWQCVMACDTNASACDTYETNYGLRPLGDVTEIDPASVPAFDVLCAGFPCQPFSQCGLHKGFDDARGTMFFHLMKFVVHHRPDVVILENVRGLLTHDKGATFTRMRDELAAVDYVLTHKVLTCSDYGLPQMRKRLFMVAARRDAPLAAHIDQVLDIDEYKRDCSLSQLLDRNFEKKIAYTIRCGGRRSPIGDKHNWDGYIVDGSEYRLTLNDCLKLQGFPSSFMLRGSIGDQWKMLGNTIPTVFTNAVGRNIAKWLEEGS